MAPELTVNVGIAFTVTVLTTPVELIQPDALVPVIVQLVVIVGLTTLDPDEYVYVDAPPGVKVNESPLHIAPELTVNVGMAFTVTVLTTPVLLTHPDALVPVTVQLVVVVGLTTLEPDEYVYVDAPLGVKVNESPLQIAPELTVNVGIAFTVTVLTTPVELIQPDALVPVTV